MEPLTIALLALATLLGVGLIRIVGPLWSILNRLTFARDYLNHYRKLLDSLAPGAQRGLTSRSLSFDESEYEWVVKRLIRMQRELGPKGVMIGYRPPFESVRYQRYELLGNTLPQVRTGHVHPHDLSRCDDIMLAHVGQLEDDRKSASLKVLNPLAWIAEGAKFIITLPLRLAYLTGLIGREAYGSATESWLVGLIAYVVAIGSGAVTIVLGWERFARIVGQWIGG